MESMLLECVPRVSDVCATCTCIVVLSLVKLILHVHVTLFNTERALCMKHINSYYPPRSGQEDGGLVGSLARATPPMSQITQHGLVACQMSQ